jgi:hypothetical protein
VAALLGREPQLRGPDFHELAARAQPRESQVRNLARADEERLARTQGGDQARDDAARLGIDDLVEVVEEDRERAVVGGDGVDDVEGFGEDRAAIARGGFPARFDALRPRECRARAPRAGTT